MLREFLSFVYCIRRRTLTSILISSSFGSEGSFCAEVSSYRLRIRRLSFSPGYRNQTEVAGTKVTIISTMNIVSRYHLA